MVLAGGQHLVKCDLNMWDAYKSIGMARKGQRQVGKVVNMYLRLVCSGAHDPVAILADAHTLAGLFKLKILQQIHTIGEFGVVFQTAFALANQPFGQGTGFAAANGVDGHVSGGDFHGGATEG